MSFPDITIPKTLPNSLENQAKLILESNAMGQIQVRFFKVDEKNMALEQAQQNDGYNWMGLPVFDAVELGSGTFTGQDGKPFSGVSYVTNDGKTINIKPMKLYNCMHVVNIPKNIIKTPIAGGDGTVKEYIGMGDAQITLSGMLVSPHADVPPDLEMKQLIDYCKAPIALPVASNFLAFFEVFNIVIEGEPSFSQIEGTRNAVMFNISCVSDKAFEIEFNKNSSTSQTSPVSVPSFS